MISENSAFGKPRSPPLPCPPPFPLNSHFLFIDTSLPPAGELKRQNSAPNALVFRSGVCRVCTPLPELLLLLLSLLLIHFSKLFRVLLVEYGNFVHLIIGQKNLISFALFICKRKYHNSGRGCSLVTTCSSCDSSVSPL